MGLKMYFHFANSLSWVYFPSLQVTLLKVLPINYYYGMPCICHGVKELVPTLGNQ